MSLDAVHYEELENGLTLLLSETRTSPVANLQIWARVGSADEGPDQAGLAHFHEHMLFKGTRTRGVGEVASAVEGAGGRINAYTSFDVTVYYATVPAEALGTAVEVLSDAVRNSIFDPEEILREQEVVIEEIRRSEDSPGHVLSDLTFQEAFTQHPYRLPILGTAESVSGLNRDKILGFFEHWYAPDNLTIVAAGDFDAKALAASIREQFADARPAGATRSRPQEPIHQAMRAAVLRRPFEKQRVDLAWPAARYRDDDATYLDLLSFLLGECESSRLVQRLRERDGLVDRIDSSSYSPFDRGLFSVGFEADEARSRHAVEAVAEEIERLRREPVSSDELERARKNFLASEHFERESVSGLASKLGGYQVLGGDYRLEARYFDVLQSASQDDLMRVAQEYLDPNALTISALVADKPEDTLDANALETAVEAGLSRSRSRFAEAPRIERREPQRSPLRESGASTQSDDGRVHSYALGDGATLHVAPRPNVPVVAARAAFLGGLLAEDDASAGLSCFLASMWSRGTEKHSNLAFARAVEDLAADVSGFSGRSSLGLTLESTRETFEPTLDLFSEVLLSPGFDGEEIERERRETLAAIARREDQLAQRAFQLFSETEFSAHPYRLSMVGERESVEAVDVARLRAHQQRLIRKPNLVMSVAGDVDPDTVAEQIRSRLAGLPGGPFEVPTPAAEPEHRGVREVVHEKDRAQAHLVVGFRGLTVADPDRHALEMISQLLAGQGGRLFLDLRDKRSLAYSVSAMNIEGLAPGFFAIYIATAPEKVEEARRGIFEHLERLVDSPPDAQELADNQRNLIGNYVIDQQRNSAVGAHMALDGLYGLGPEAHRDYPEQIAAITQDDVLRVARRIIRLGDYTEALVRP